jgi:polyisoprenoid-binding protein YceI
MPTQTWNLDASHTSVNFSVRHLVIAKVRGRFSKFSGQFTVDTVHPEGGTVEATIEAGSIDTHDAQRDGHLKSADFLDVEKYPTLTFKSTAIKAVDAGFQVSGDLTIHGVTRPVVLEVESGGVTNDPWGNSKVAYTARTHIDRRDFGLVWNKSLETGGVLVGDRVDIEIDVEAALQK